MKGAAHGNVKAEKRARVLAMLDRGMSQAAIAKALGVDPTGISRMVRAMSGPITCDPGFPQPRSTLDNAIRAAFRKVIGYDPIRDLEGCPMSREKTCAWRFCL